MIFTVGKHLQVLMESPESIARREENPRRRKRWEMSCTCNMRRQENGHCPHTLALLENNIHRSEWRRITATPMNAKDVEPLFPEVPRIELEREVLALRVRVKELESA